MFCKFDEIFNPSLEKREKQAKFFNSITDQNLEKYGDSCRTCAHCKYIQDSPYSYHTECDLTGKEINWEKPKKCDHYKFTGYYTADMLKHPWQK